MLSQFRHVPVDLYPDDVTLHLYKTVNGSARANVKGPRGPVVGGVRTDTEISVARPLSEAFAVAIRMANANDVSVFVTGDETLWQPEWGDLQTA